MPAAEEGTGSSRAIRGPAVASQLSKTRNVPIGVFQGCALSRLLYLLYANDLSLCVDEGVNIVGETGVHSVMGHILSAGFSQKLSSLGTVPRS